jgi:hypothetical protein
LVTPTRSVLQRLPAIGVKIRIPGFLTFTVCLTLTVRRVSAEVELRAAGIESVMVIPVAISGALFVTTVVRT